MPPATVPFEVDPRAAAPATWLHYLNEWFSGDADSIGRLSAIFARRATLFAQERAAP